MPCLHNRQATRRADRTKRRTWRSATPADAPGGTCNMPDSRLSRQQSAKAMAGRVDAIADFDSRRLDNDWRTRRSLIGLVLGDCLALTQLRRGSRPGDHSRCHDREPGANCDEPVRLPQVRECPVMSGNGESRDACILRELIAGKSIQETAPAASVSEKTVSKACGSALSRRAPAEKGGGARRRGESSGVRSCEAAETLSDLLSSRHDGVRLRAARATLELAARASEREDVACRIERLERLMLPESSR